MDQLSVEDLLAAIQAYMTYVIMRLDDETGFTETDYQMLVWLQVCTLNERSASVSHITDNRRLCVTASRSDAVGYGLNMSNLNQVWLGRIGLSPSLEGGK